MPQLLELITQTIGGDTVDRIGSQIGADRQTTQSAIAAALPMLVGALAHNSSNAAGAQSLHDALERDHDGSALDNLGGLLGNLESGPGGGILRHVLGDRQPGATQAVSKASGLDSQRTMQLLMLLAPIIMGALGRARRQQNLQPAGLAGLLGQEREHLASASPDLMGMATRLLDRDGDGSVTNELGGLVGKLFGR